MKECTDILQILDTNVCASIVYVASKMLFSCFMLLYFLSFLYMK